MLKNENTKTKREKLISSLILSSYPFLRQASSHMCAGIVSARALKESLIFALSSLPRGFRSCQELYENGRKMDSNNQDLRNK